ncbi:MAG: hypothetical protein ACI9A7_000918 [Cyclobacteriaceae bacterium]|jgi:hypothetical protein
MKKILGYLKDYRDQHFDLKLHIVFFLFMACCVAINYYFDFEDSIVDKSRETPWHFVHMFLFHAFPYICTCIILLIFNKNTTWWKSSAFWLRLVIGFAILSFDRTFYGYKYLINHLPYDEYFYWYKVIRWANAFFTVVIPFILIYLMLESDKPRHFYGLNNQKFDPKPYFVILGIALVFIGIGSFFSDIQNYYPRFQHTRADIFAANRGIDVWIPIAIYEVAYGSDFIGVEILFRGFFIFAFVKILGPHAILPMAATYCFLHFGKPMTEAISSVFGGYLLGIISYYSKSIWGGIIVHVGIAWGMEIFGYLQGL